MKTVEIAPRAAPAWSVTFGDLMCLLLTFFVLLLSFSVMEESKINEALASIQGALGVMEKNTIFEFVRVAEEDAQGHLKGVERSARRLQRRMQVLGMDQDVSVAFNEESGLRISLSGELLFESGRADLKLESLPVLRNIGAVLADVPDKFVEVRGHTDNGRLDRGERFRDHRDLSYERARNVMAFFTGPAGMRPEDFELVALGDSQPIASNDTEEGRKANRRVEIQIRGDFSQETLESVRGHLIQRERAAVPFGR